MVFSNNRKQIPLFLNIFLEINVADIVVFLR